MSNSAAFSYAQAAKGQSAVPPVPAVPGSQSSTTASKAPSTTSTQSRDAAPTPSTRAPSVAISTTSNELDGSQNTRSSSVKPESFNLNNNHDSDNISTSDKTAEMSNLPNQGNEKVLGEVVPQSIERRGRGHTLTSQTTDAGDSKRARKGKKGRTIEKEPEEDQDQDKKENVPPKPLSEAPVPTVNIWTQRQEAMAAKAKAAPTTSQSRASNATNGIQPDGPSNHASQELKQRTSQNDGVDATVAQNKSLSNGVRPPRKDNDQSRGAGNQAPRRTAPRGSRANNGEERPPFEALGSVANNTSSWPTPETAANDLKAQAPLSKPEKEQKEESGPNKPRQKKGWTHIDFVPTVNFETPLPVRGSRGGRTPGTRGGRDATVRGNHSAGTSTDRTQENGTTPAATSVAPPSSKRASIDTTPSRDSRKAQAQAGTGKVSGDTVSANGKADMKQHVAELTNGLAGQHVSARTTNSNQRVDDAIKSTQPTKENGIHATEDSNFQGQNGVARNERTRGNTRGRGGHSSMNGITHPQSQFGQGSPGYNYSPNANLRQSNNPYSPGYTHVSYNPFPVQTTGSQHRSRPSSGNNRSQGNPRHQSSRSAYPTVGVPYDSAMYPQANNSPYTAYPDPNHILSGVLSQVEYYFSIDNLCKDWYLRKFMDSQGFVPLNVIAMFKRMQEIAQDYNLVRIACDSSPHIEFVVTEDGQDKVRRQDQWQPWVLAMHERHPSAQNDGPISYRPFNGQMAFWPQVLPYGGETAPIYSPTGAESNFTHHINTNHIATSMNNGVNGHVHPSGSQLSATVPEFSPIGIPGLATASQQGTALSDALSSDPNLENSLKKGISSPFGEQVNSLPNGFHKSGHLEQNGVTETPATNGVAGAHGTEAY